MSEAGKNLQQWIPSLCLSPFPNFPNLFSLKSVWYCHCSFPGAVTLASLTRQCTVYARVWILVAVFYLCNFQLYIPQTSFPFSENIMKMKIHCFNLVIKTGCSVLKNRTCLRWLINKWTMRLLTPLPFTEDPLSSFAAASETQRKEHSSSKSPVEGSERHSLHFSWRTENKYSGTRSQSSVPLFFSGIHTSHALLTPALPLAAHIWQMTEEIR